MTGATRLARTSVLILLLIGVLSPVPAFASGPPWYFYNQCTSGGRYDYQIHVSGSIVPSNGIWWVSTVDSIDGDKVYGSTPVGAPGPCGYPKFQGTNASHPDDLQGLMLGVPDGNYVVADNNSISTDGYDPSLGYGNGGYFFFHIKNGLVYMDGEPNGTTTVTTTTPPPVHNAVVWASTSAQPNELRIYTPSFPNPWFGGTATNPSVKLGVWDKPDFTATASTTVHIWSRWNGSSSNLLDVTLRTSKGGDPFYGTGYSTSTAEFITPQNDSYYRLGVTATSTLQEYTIPARIGETIHKGDEVWALLIPSYSAYGADHWVGSNGAMPYMEICEGPCDASTTPPTPSGPSSVLFLPGIESSRLYEKVFGIENRRWEPTLLNFQHDGQALVSNPDGSSINQIYTKKGDAIATLQLPGQFDIYRTFFEKLKSLKTAGEITDYEVFPYDWRVAPDDILSQGVQYDDGIHYLDKELLALASSSASGKVTIVAHSNGGLVAKALIQKLEHDGHLNKVDKIIFVDVPQLGTPKAINSMLHGDDTGFRQALVLSQTTQRSVSEYMPDAYDLLPSNAYFNAVSDPVIDLSNAPVLKSASGISLNTISSQDDLEKFITPLSGRTKASATDTNTPTIISTTLLAKAKVLHAALDIWQPPAGMQVIQIAGWGVPTQKGVVYSEKNTAQCIFEHYLCPLGVLIEHNATTTEDGDGTVVIPSETALAATTYYINIPEIAKTSGKYVDHSNITEAIAFQSIFEKLLSSSNPDTLPLHVTTQKPINTSLGARLQLRLHSPVSFQVYDQQGRHTGIVHDAVSGTDFLEQGIPNVYYYQYGESKFLSLPNDPTFIVKLQGTDTGTFTLDITSLDQGTSQTVTYADIPVSIYTTGTIVPSGNISQPVFSLDTNGDSVIDTTFSSPTQMLDPLQYVKFIRSTLSTYSINARTKRALDARYANIQTILTKEKKWDTDDDDGDENDIRKGEKDTTRALRKLDHIDSYINKLLKPEGKNKTSKVTQVQAITLLDMDGILKRLIK